MALNFTGRNTSICYVLWNEAEEIDTFIIFEIQLV